MPFNLLVGSLNSSKDAIVVDGDLNDCAVFALWLSHTLKRNGLTFYDEGYVENISLDDSDVNTIVSTFQNT